MNGWTKTDGKRRGGWVDGRPGVDCGARKW